ncbi:MAG: 30S ribosomal protein S9 [Bernardetiaceae bacterium]|nr:30S ribosomal protein S9 [Bernardetiaceae bacterium]
MERLHTIGRRKKAVARIYMKPGSGVIKVNGRELEEYFPTLSLKNAVLEPFEVSGKENSFDVEANVFGGGVKGQAGAIRLAIARALQTDDPEARPALKSAGHLTRDPRMVERKKYGRRKARRRFQFSKR